MVSRTFQFLLLIIISSTFFLLTHRQTSIRIETFKSLDPRVLIRSGHEVLQDWGHCLPINPFNLATKPLRFQQPIPIRPLKALDDQDFCPPSGPGRRSTAILIPIGQGLEAWDSDSSQSRTYFLSPQDSATQTDQSELGFLPFLKQDPHQHLQRHPARLNPNMTDSALCPVYYVPASPLFHPIPPPRGSPIPSAQGGLTAALTTRLYKLRQTLMIRMGVGCPTQPRHSLPEIELWHRRGYAELMFGFATTPQRALEFLPRWSEWLPSALPIDLESELVNRWRATSLPPMRRPTASALVLTPPELELDQAWEVQNAARGAGMDVKLKPLQAERFEVRYMRLVQEMWRESVEREGLGAPLTQWFILADDDTYFLSLDSVARMLAKYDPFETHLIGSVSESESSAQHFGNIAFGGAGIFLSRGLMQQINEPGAFESCVSLFAKEFGGDGMITKCAAMMMRRDVQQVVSREPTLHQLDIRDEGHGIFQAGWRFTSLHHWRSWFQLQPRAHPHTLKDASTLASLLGNAARAIAPENWTRRYVWGLNPVDGPPQPGVMISLGYSITVIGPGHLSAPDLDKVEMTFAGNKLTSETRPALLETKQRRTYYLYDLKTSSSEPQNLNQQPDVAVMSHINQEGETIDLVWDARPRSTKGSFEDAYSVYSTQQHS